MKTIQLTKALLLGGGLAAAAIGQFYFARKPDYTLDAVVFYGAGISMFLAAVRLPAEHAATPHRPLRLTPALLVRSVPIAAGLLLGLLAVLQLVDPHDSYWSIFWTWIAGSLLFLLGFARSPEWSWRESSPGRRVNSSRGRLATARALGLLNPWARNVAALLAGPGRPPVSAAAAAGVDGLPAGSGGPLVVERRATPRLRSLISSPALEWLFVLLLVAGALLLRVWRLDTIPWTLGGDEGNFGLYARSVLTGQVRNMFVTGHLSMPTMYSFFQAGWLVLAGDDTVGLRLPWAVLGALSVLGAFLLVRRLFGRNLALLTGFLLATYHFHIHYSRLGINNISDPLFISWALYFLVLAWQARRRWAWVASGMLGGLAFYSYTGSRLVPMLLLSVIAWACLTEHDFWGRHRHDLLAMLGGFLLVFGPMGLFALQHPNDFNARINQIGILQSGWLDRAAAATGQSQVALILDQLRRAFLAFNFYHDRTDFYKPAIPLMDFASSIFLVLGAAWALAHILPPRGEEGSAARTRYAIMVIWFILALLIGGALTESPPSSQRLVASSVPAIFFVALALREITRVLRETLAWPEGLRRAVVGIIALVLALVSLRYYFVTYQQSWVYGSFNAEVATRIGYYLRDLAASPGSAASAASAATQPSAPIEEYFFGAPRMYADFGSTPFIARGVPLHDVDKPLRSAIPSAGPAVRPVFVFLPERAAELQWVRQTYPLGIVQEVHRLDDPAKPLLFIAYRPQ